MLGDLKFKVGKRGRRKASRRMKRQRAEPRMGVGWGEVEWGGAGRRR